MRLWQIKCLLARESTAAAAAAVTTATKGNNNEARQRPGPVGAGG